jgi:hypothetical protein
MSTCPWSDIILGVAWSVWHNEQLFGSMKTAISCPLLSGNKHEKKVEWWKWLTSTNKEKTEYNIHSLWVWYNDNEVSRMVKGKGSRA